MLTPASLLRNSCSAVSALALWSWPCIGNSGLAAETQAPLPKPLLNGSMRFESQGPGSQNVLSGTLFAPLRVGSDGSVLFLDSSLNWNFGGALNQNSFGVSSRLGQRWLSKDRRWIYGFNGGIDTQPVNSNYVWQAGLGAELLNRSMELRLNGALPFSNSSSILQSGWTTASLQNNSLILDGWQQYAVALSGINAEVGLPIRRWNGGSLWGYGSYYYLNGEYVTPSSGVRLRAEVRLGPTFAFGATVSYDPLFESRATGYVRLGSRSQTSPSAAATAIRSAEEQFLSLRGLPVERQRELHFALPTVARPQATAINPATGQAWVVRCAGATTSSYGVACGYGSLADALAATTASNDVLLLGGGLAEYDMALTTRRLPVGASLAGAGYGPTLATQFGGANLAPIFGTAIGGQPSIRNGIFSIGSNTSIAGLSFTNVSITNYSTSNVLITGNSFTGSYTDNPTDLADAQAFGSINVSALALPVIQLSNASNVTISGNSFSYPQAQTYVSQQGPVDDNGTGYVCNQNNLNTSGLCLSANAIRFNNVSNGTVSGNTVVGALDEAFRINNPTGKLVISDNTISDMRMGPDSNIGSAIIVGQNQGDALVEIIGNTITNNSRGIYPVVTAAFGPVNVAGSGKNVIDPIEIGLCRGTTSYPRAADLYASADFSGNCVAPTTMTIKVANNSINLPAISGGISQDGDGIDFNVGANAILKAQVIGNRVNSLGSVGTGNIGDNGLTFDFRGNAIIGLGITSNHIENAGDAAIGFSLQNTPFANLPGRANISLTSNTFGPSVSPSVEADLVQNTGSPVSTFAVAGTGTNLLNTVNRQTFNTGPYPDLYINGVLYP
jgi:hypothetical protein